MRVTCTFRIEQRDYYCKPDYVLAELLKCVRLHLISFSSVFLLRILPFYYMLLMLLIQPTFFSRVNTAYFLFSLTRLLYMGLSTILHYSVMYCILEYCTTTSICFQPFPLAAHLLLWLLLQFILYCILVIQRFASIYNSLVISFLLMAANVLSVYYFCLMNNLLCMDIFFEFQDCTKINKLTW